MLAWATWDEAVGGPELTALVPGDVDAAVRGRLSALTTHPLGTSIGIDEHAVDDMLRGMPRADARAVRREILDHEALLAVRDDEHLVVLRSAAGAHLIESARAAPPEVSGVTSTVAGDVLQLTSERTELFFAERSGVVLVSSDDELMADALALRDDDPRSLSQRLGGDALLAAERDERILHGYARAEYVDDLLFHGARGTPVGWIGDALPPDSLRSVSASLQLGTSRARITLHATRRAAAVRAPGPSATIPRISFDDAAIADADLTESGAALVRHALVGLGEITGAAEGASDAVGLLSPHLGRGASLTIVRLPETDGFAAESRALDAPRPLPGMLLALSLRDGMDASGLADDLETAWGALAGGEANLSVHDGVLSFRALPRDESYQLLTPAAAIHEDVLLLASNADLLERARGPVGAATNDSAVRAEIDFDELRAHLLDRRGVEARELLHRDLDDLRPMLTRRVRVKRHGEGLTDEELEAAVDAEVAAYRHRIATVDFPAMIEAEMARWAFLDDWDAGELRIDTDAASVRITFDLQFR